MSDYRADRIWSSGSDLDLDRCNLRTDGWVEICSFGKSVYIVSIHAAFSGFPLGVCTPRCPWRSQGFTFAWKQNWLAVEEIPCCGMHKFSLHTKHWSETLCSISLYGCYISYRLEKSRCFRPTFFGRVPHRARVLAPNSFRVWFSW
jgi:hypothetical protein